MQVNVFITRKDGKLQNQLLVLPAAPMFPVPEQYRSGWTYFVTTNTEDRMFGDTDAVSLEAQLASQGYAVLDPPER
jgi:hypothetical protein